MKRKLPKNAIPHQWKPGQTGNPGGRPPNPIPNVLRKMTNQQLVRIIKAVVKGNIDEIKRIAKDPMSSGMEVAVAMCFSKAAERGDWNTIEKMLERIVGKVPDKLIVDSVNKNLNANLNAEISEEKVKAALAKLESEV